MTKRREKMCYLFVLFCIFATDSMITISINTNTAFYYGFRWIAIILCPLFFIFTINVRRMSKSWTLIIGTLTISLMITALINSDYAMVILLKLVYFLLGYCAVKFFLSKNILKAFSNIMVVIAIISLVCYFISLFSISVFDFLPNIRIVAAKSGRVSNFANAIFCIIAKESWSAFPRNYGMFAEPGIYQVYIVFALIAILYGDGEKKKIKTILLVIAMITTFSTTGYIVMLCLFLFYFTTSYNTSPKVKILSVVGTVVVVFFLVQNEFIFDTVFGKLQDSGDASTVSRLYSFPINFVVWLRNPIVGVGPVHMNDYIKSIALSMTRSAFFHNTNTYMYTLACFGLPVFLIEIFKGIKLARELTGGGIFKMLGLFIVIFVCLSGENLTYSLCIEVLLFCGLFRNN